MCYIADEFVPKAVQYDMIMDAPVGEPECKPGNGYQSQSEQYLGQDLSGKVLVVAGY